MKRFALLGSVIAVAAFALFATSSAVSCDKKSEPTTGVMYEMWDCLPDGIFRIVNAGGQFVEVHAVNGEMVWAGHVPEDYFEFPCPNFGVGAEGDVLHAYTSGGAYFCIDRDDDWIWE